MIPNFLNFGDRSIELQDSVKIRILANSEFKLDDLPINPYLALGFLGGCLLFLLIMLIACVTCARNDPALENQKIIIPKDNILGSRDRTKTKVTLYTKDYGDGIDDIVDKEKIKENEMLHDSNLELKFDGQDQVSMNVTTRRKTFVNVKKAGNNLMANDIDKKVKSLFQ